MTMPWKSTDLIDLLVMGIVIALVILLLCSLACGQTVTRVIDGDTIVLDTGQTVNLHGIDAPELDQPHGKEARSYLVTLVLDRTVELTAVQDAGFGAISAGVFWRKLDIARTVCKHGGAWSLGAYDDEQRAAQADQRGLWRRPAIKPSSWRAGYRPSVSVAPVPVPVPPAILWPAPDLQIHPVVTGLTADCVGNT